ncbi:MAG: hypothetical protein ACU837_12610 [Gammaproteobacteria bacterium]
MRTLLTALFLTVSVTAFAAPEKGTAEQPDLVEGLVSKLLGIVRKPQQALVRQTGDKSAVDLRKTQNATHDDYPPDDYPDEWDSISTDERICWFHKISRKKVCNDQLSAVPTTPEAREKRAKDLAWKAFYVESADCKAPKDWQQTVACSNDKIRQHDAFEKQYQSNR